MHYDLSLSYSLPSSILLYFLLAIITLQTCDAIDGKQARLTDTTSALGHIFDQGADAYAFPNLVLIVCQVMKLGGGLLSYLLLYAVAVFFT